MSVIAEGLRKAINVSKKINKTKIKIPSVMCLETQQFYVLQGDM